MVLKIRLIQNRLYIYARSCKIGYVYSNNAGEPAVEASLLIRGFKEEKNSFKFFKKFH